MLGLRWWDGSSRDEIELEVFGMACRHCRGTVQTVLEDLPGVHTADVSLAEGRARLAVEATVEAQGLVETLRNVGYEARPALSRG